MDLVKFPVCHSWQSHTWLMGNLYSTTTCGFVTTLWNIQSLGSFHGNFEPWTPNSITFYLLNRYAKLIPSMMLNKPRIKTWAQPNLMCEPTRIELRQDLINSAMTPMFKATALEVRNDEKIQTFQPNSTGFNPITPFRPKTQRGIGLFQQRIEQQAQMSTSTNQFSSINKSKIDSVSTNSMISSLLSTPVIIRKKPSYRGEYIDDLRWPT